MSQTPDPHPEPSEEGALLAAYLDGDTDDVTTARIERRLADDDAFAARLDAVADVRVRLQRLSDVRAPQQARQRVRERLAAERAGPTPAMARTHPTGRRARRWLPGAATAAAVALVAVLGLAALVASLGGRGGSAVGEAGAGEEAPGMAEADRAAGTAAAPAGDSGPDSEAAAATDDDGAAVEAPVQSAPTVASDAEIAARALRQRERGLNPGQVRARERRLRQATGLPTDRLCVRDLEARAVDVVDEDGRVSLVVVLAGADAQIVLLDPRTCVPVRTIADGGG